MKIKKIISSKIGTVIALLICMMTQLLPIVHADTEDTNFVAIGTRYRNYKIVVDENGRYTEGSGGHAMETGYGYTYDSATTSQKWPMYSIATKGILKYTKYINFAFNETNLNNNIEELYLGFSIYVDTKNVSDLPQVAFGKSSGGWTWSNWYDLAGNIELGKWNDVRVKVSDIAGTLDLSAVTQLRFKLKKAVSADYNIYLKNVGFFAFNIGEEEIYDDNSTFNKIYEKSPRVTIGDGLYRVIRNSIFGIGSSEPYCFYSGDKEKGSYIIYKTKGIISDFQIDAFTTNQKADPNAVHEIYASADGKNYVKLEENSGYLSELKKVENNKCEWFTYYKMRRLTMKRDANLYSYRYIKIVFPDVDSTVSGQARYASMLGDVHIWTINPDAPTFSIENSDDKETDNTVTLKFSKRMNESDFKAENFELSGGKVTSAVYSDETKSAVLTLENNLSEDTDYTLTISKNVKSVMDESIEENTATFKTKNNMVILSDDNADFSILADKSKNVEISTMFGSSSSEPHVYRIKGGGHGNYVTYKIDGIITGFDFQVYSSTDRHDKVNYPFSDKFPIYVSEDGVNFTQLEEGNEFDRKNGEKVKNNAITWFTYYQSFRFISNNGKIAPKYKYIKIQFPDTDVDYSASIGDSKIYYTDIPYAAFNGFVGQNSINICFGKEMNADTFNKENFVPSDKINVAAVELSSDKKSAVITFDKTVTDSDVYYLDINKNVRSTDGKSVFKGSRRVFFRQNSAAIGETERNEWTNARFGCGGMITGIVFHPTEKDLAYVRTDVGGAYRYDSKYGEWIPLNDSLTESDKNLMGIAGIAIDPQNPDVVYLAAGTYWYRQSYGSDVLKSTDRGKTWSKTGLNVVFEGNNGDGRRWGECIAVDPNNSNVIYCGTRYKGLAASDDGAQSWYFISDVESGIKTPNENSYQGTRVVTFDKESAVTSEGRTSTVYVASDGMGVYKTNDGGRNWSLIEGSPKSVLRMECIGGKCYMASKSGVFAYANGVLTDVTPEKLKGRKVETVCTSYTADGKPVVIVTGEGDYPVFYIYRKIGDGDWELCSSEINASNIEINEMTWATIGINFCATAINPFPENEGEIQMWGLDGRGMWKSTDMLSDNIKYSFEVKGIEETCINNIVSVPGDAPYVAIMDYSGWKMENENTYGNYHFSTMPSALTDHVAGEYIGQMTNFDFCEENPKYIAFSGDYVTFGMIGESEDGGKTWRNNGFPTTVGAGMGDVAVSSQIKDGKYPVMIACARKDDTDRDIYTLWSDDWGRTWHICEGLPANIYKGSQYNQDRNVIEPDRVKGNVFYAINQDTGEIYVSEDWGQTFEKSKASAKGANTGEYTSIIASPKNAGEVYIVSDNNLYKSTDGLKTLTRLPEFEYVNDISYGKEKDGSEYMSLYVFGNINGVRGLFRSDDNGSSWIKMNDERYGLSIANKIEADRDVWGKVYVGTGGRGVHVCSKPSYEYSLTAGGKTVDEIPEGDFSVELDIQKEINSSASLIAALYKGGSLVGTFMSEEKNVLSSACFKTNISTDSDFDTVRCFLWNMDELKPFCEAAEYKKASYTPYSLILDETGKKTDSKNIGASSSPLWVEAKYDTELCKTGSARWEITSKDTAGDNYVRYVNYDFPSINLIQSEKELYFGFTYYCDTDKLSDLPKAAFGRNGGGWRWSNEIKLSDSFRKGMWNTVYIKVSDVENSGLDMTDINQIRFSLSSPSESDYNLYVKNMGFFTKN